MKKTLELVNRWAQTNGEGREILGGLNVILVRKTKAKEIGRVRFMQSRSGKTVWARFSFHVPPETPGVLFYNWGKCTTFGFSLAQLAEGAIRDAFVKAKFLKAAETPILCLEKELVRFVRLVGWKKGRLIFSHMGVTPD